MKGEKWIEEERGAASRGHPSASPRCIFQLVTAEEEPNPYYSDAEEEP